MAIALARVDDRLIHGQVVIGWGRPLDAKMIVLVDEVVRYSDWEQEIYRMAVPADMQVVFATVQEAGARLAEWQGSPQQVIVLTGDIATMAALYSKNPAALSSINLGGVHHRPGRTERLRFLYLSPEEAAMLNDLTVHGAVITAQDLPASRAVPVAEVLG